MNIVFCGTIGASGTSGQAWANLQYLLGLRELGHKVFYLEDYGKMAWAYDWKQGEFSSDIRNIAQTISSTLSTFDLDTSWACRDDENIAGTTQETLTRQLRSTDLIIMRAWPISRWRDEYLSIPKRAFIDVDPGFTQIKYCSDTREGVAFRKSLQSTTHMFTYALAIGQPDCLIPQTDRAWIPTMPPVHISSWPFSDAAADTFTTVARWRGFRDIEGNGLQLGQRDKEFSKFSQLPILCRQRMQIAQNGFDTAMLAANGWSSVPGEEACRTPDNYQTYIQTSKAEICIAKHAYVTLRSGWISDRSVCYLASGRPVVMSDTGIPDLFPMSLGLLTFKGLASAVEQVATVNNNYLEHRKSSRQLAEEVFCSKRVLSDLIAQTSS